MLRSNLSTRPFYNARGVRIGIGIGVVLVAALTAFNAAQVLTLNSRNSELAGRAEDAEAQALQFRNQAEATRKTLEQNDASMVQAAAQEANQLIERRAFSWTDLFNRLEDTLPPDVRVTGVEPQVDRDGRMMVVLSVLAKRVEDLEAFMAALEKTGAFRDVLPRSDTTDEEGLLVAVVQGYYNPLAAAPETTAPAPSSDGSGGATQNASPKGPAPPEGAR